MLTWKQIPNAISPQQEKTETSSPRMVRRAIRGMAMHRLDYWSGDTTIEDHPDLAIKQTAGSRY